MRLLFGREFAFDDMLPMWDLLFAADPTLHLVDFVSIAMLLRIRWQRRFSSIFDPLKRLLSLMQYSMRMQTAPLLFCCAIHSQLRNTRLGPSSKMLYN